MVLWVMSDPEDPDLVTPILSIRRTTGGTFDACGTQNWKHQFSNKFSGVSRPVCRVFQMVCLETFHALPPSWKKEAVVSLIVTMILYEDQLNTWFSKWFSKWSSQYRLRLSCMNDVCGCMLVCFVTDYIFTPLNMTLNKTDCTWLLYMSGRHC